MLEWPTSNLRSLRVASDDDFLRAVLARWYVSSMEIRRSSERRVVMSRDGGLVSVGIVGSDWLLAMQVYGRLGQDAMQNFSSLSIWCAIEGVDSTKFRGSKSHTWVMEEGKRERENVD
jgi:hypothetical protein